MEVVEQQFDRRMGEVIRSCWKVHPRFREPKQLSALSVCDFWKVPNRTLIPHCQHLSGNLTHRILSVANTVGEKGLQAKSKGFYKQNVGILRGFSEKRCSMRKRRIFKVMRVNVTHSYLFKVTPRKLFERWNIQILLSPEYEVPLHREMNFDVSPAPSL